MGSCAQTGGRQPARWYPDPIVTKKAEGPAWAYWQALVEGDVGALSRLLGDPQAALGPNAVFDTSDLEEWKNYRFNFRCLRTAPLPALGRVGWGYRRARPGCTACQAPGAETGCWGAAVGGGWHLPVGALPGVELPLSAPGMFLAMGCLRLGVGCTC